MVVGALVMEALVAETMVVDALVLETTVVEALVVEALGLEALVLEALVVEALVVEALMVEALVVKALVVEMGFVTETGGDVDKTSVLLVDVPLRSSTGATSEVGFTVITVVVEAVEGPMEVWIKTGA